MGMQQKQKTEAKSLGFYKFLIDKQGRGVIQC